jgi:N-acetylglucosamine kinase-like BadF-type ATPase
MGNELFLGLDGGAAKTAGVILGCEGNILAQHRAPGSSIPSAGKLSAGSCSVLFSLIKDICNKAGITRKKISLCVVGLNGVDFPDQHTIQLREIARATKISAERLTLVNDGIIALWGATTAPAAVILQHGSGFTGAFRARHGEEILFDHLNTCRTFDIRGKLISLVARMIHGRAIQTSLKDSVLKFFDVEEDKYCEMVYRNKIPPEKTMNTVPLIFEAWQSGDPAASQLIHRAVDDYALAAKAMITKTGCPIPDVVFGGGVIARAPEEFWNLLAERIRSFYPDVAVKPPDLPPEFGAGVMAAYKAGYEPHAFFHKVREGIVERDKNE